MNRKLCSRCELKPPTSYCYCNRQDIFLCEDCIQPHRSENESLLHNISPMSSFPDNTAPGYYDRLSARLLGVVKGTEALLRNSLKVTTCLGEFNSKVSQIIGVLTDYAENMRNQLQTIKTEMETNINAAIQEVDETMYVDNPVLHSELAESLRDFGQGCHTLELFDYEIDQSPFPATLDSILRFNHGQQESDPATGQLLIEATQKISELETRLTKWGITSDPPTESQDPIPDYCTSQSSATLRQFGRYQGEDSELIMIKRGPVLSSIGVYTGQWNTQNKQHGYGKFVSKGGVVYEGQWRNGSMTGFGRYIWPNGNMYIGEFVQGQSKGLGTKYYTNGEVHSGTWVNDKLHGVGSIKFRAGAQYTDYFGEFVEDVRAGHGVAFDHDGNLYAGSWRQNKAHGQGVNVWANGVIYLGDWEYDRKSGIGCLVYPSKGIIQGLWKDDKFCDQ